MPRTLGLCLTLALALIAVWPANAPASEEPAVVDPLAGTPVHSVYMRLPSRAASATGPLQVLLALHGMGGNGEAFARALVEPADRYGWLLVAPTIEYGDWKNPDAVAKEDPLLIQSLGDYIAQLPARTGMKVRRQVLILGHSRGAQLAHRFAEFRPRSVLAVAALSAGTYTLPDDDLNFPYGVQDMDQYAGYPFDASSFDAISFWVAVGGQDNNPGDLPRQWDGVEGTNRVQRAQAFVEAMQELGANSELRVFGGAQHELTGEMRTAACDFLEGAYARDSGLNSVS